MVGREPASLSIEGKHPQLEDFPYLTTKEGSCTILIDLNQVVNHINLTM